MNRVEKHLDKDLNGQLTRAAWLEPARAQSRRRAEEKGALRPPPLEWETMSGPARRRRGIGARGLRLSWVTALALIMLASGATGTWAYVKHLKAKAARVARAARVAKKPAKPRLVKAKVRRRAPRAEVPASAPMEPPAPTPTRVARKSKTKKTAHKPEAAPQESPAAKGKGEIMFDDPSMPGGGHVIIVRPPVKLGPLFEPEKYRQKGPGMSW